MKTLVVKYSPPGDIVYDPFACKHATGRACALLPLHRIGILGDIDDDYAKFAKMKFIVVSSTFETRIRHWWNKRVGRSCKIGSSFYRED